MKWKYSRTEEIIKSRKIEHSHYITGYRIDGRLEKPARVPSIWYKNPDESMRVRNDSCCCVSNGIQYFAKYEKNTCIYFREFVGKTLGFIG